MSIQWYPGHMRKATREMTKILSSVDVILEVLDARAPVSTSNPVIKEIKRVSKPGRRIFSSADSLPKINNGLGIAIISTPKGVMTDIDARKQRVGGEIICKVF